MGGNARLPQTQFAIAIAYAKLVALLGEATACDLGIGARGAWTADRLLVSPFPDLYGAILATSQIQWHQGMCAHALHIIHLVAQHLKVERERVGEGIYRLDLII